jgi:hypothetical protein
MARYLHNDGNWELLNAPDVPDVFTPSLVQSKSSAMWATTPSATVSFDVLPSAGNLIVAAAVSRHVHATVTPPVELTELVVGLNSTENDFAAIYAGLSDGSNGFQWDYTVNDVLAVWLAEFSGDWTSVVAESTTSRSRQSDTGGAIGALTIAQPSLVIACMGARLDVDGTWDSPLSPVADLFHTGTGSEPTTNLTSVVLERSSNVTPTVTLSGSAVNFASAVAIKIQ